jgi:hypothetical protein
MERINGSDFESHLIEDCERFPNHRLVTVRQEDRTVGGGGIVPSQPFTDGGDVPFLPFTDGGDGGGGDHSRVSSRYGA